MYRLPRAVRVAPLLAAGVAATFSTPLDREKLPIYPQPDTEILVQEVPSELERQIGIARKSLTATYREAQGHVQGLVSRWIGVEQAVEHRVKSIISPEESLTPGILYVGVATLSGSILARNRALPLRILLPPVLLALSANHFLPKTTSNLSTYLSNLEDTYLPTIAEKHDIANAHARMTWERIKDATKSGREGLDKGVVGAVERIQEATGLKLKETFGLGKEVEKQVEGKVMQAVRAAEVKFDETRKASEEKVREVRDVELEKAKAKFAEVKNVVEEKVVEAKNVVEDKVVEAKGVVKEKAEEVKAAVDKKEPKKEEPPKRLV